MLVFVILLCCYNVESQASMPPFCDEPGEKTPKPLSYLAFGAPHGSKQRPGSAFGPESEEGRGRPASRNTVKRAFGDELEESENRSGFAKRKARPSKLSQTAFGEEGSEDESGAVSTKCCGVDKPFGEEASESDHGCSSPSNDEAYLDQTESVFSFVWNSVATFKKATFWLENMNDEKAKKPKRAYDNTNRAAKASYSREKSKGFF